jgi:hypothetical protein
MDLLDKFRERFDLNEFEFSRHAVDQAIRRNINVAEIRQAVTRAEIIEDYPNDKFGPSCLLFGFTNFRRPLHIHCSYPERILIKLITIYEPDPHLWIDFKTRKSFS